MLVFKLAFSSLWARARTTFIAVPFLHVKGRPPVITPKASIPMGRPAHGNVVVVLWVIGSTVRSGKGHITTVALLRTRMGS